ncbi:MAG: iron ABC transporter permease [Bacteroidetes bacterium]|nr:MAG: iron ABC transporter permease [Bacteroidota bacterium]
MRRSYLFALLSGLLILLLLLHLFNGSWDWDFKTLLKSLTDFDISNTQEVIFREIRFPRTVTAILAGAGLSIAGLLMQTYFNNSLAGPSVLGISSGSSLFVALAVLSGWELLNTAHSLVFAALIGAFLFSLLILFFSAFVRSAISLLLIGMMLGSFTSAVIQVIQLGTHAERLKSYLLWGFGSLQQNSFEQLGLFFLVFLLACASLIFLIKPLNLLVLGEKQARILGTNIALNRMILIAVASVFAGLITAYCGPISFIGLAVPNVVRQLYRTKDHRYLLLGSALFGAITLLICDLVIIYVEPFLLLPLNAITALIGAPVVVWIILKRF